MRQLAFPRSSVSPASATTFRGICKEQDHRVAGKAGLRVISVKELAAHGLDLRAKRTMSNYYYSIEVKGDPKLNPEKTRYPFLVFALGEIVQRVAREKYCRYALALPASYESLVKRRVPPAAAKRLDLEFLFVYPKGQVRRLNWRELQEVQSGQWRPLSR